MRTKAPLKTAMEQAMTNALNNAKPKRVIQSAPKAGKIPIEKIQRAVDAVSKSK